MAAYSGVLAGTKDLEWKLIFSSGKLKACFKQAMEDKKTIVELW